MAQWGKGAGRMGPGPQNRPAAGAEARRSFDIPMKKTIRQGIPEREGRLDPNGTDGPAPDRRSGRSAVFSISGPGRQAAESASPRPEAGKPFDSTLGPFGRPPSPAGNGLLAARTNAIGKLRRGKSAVNPAGSQAGGQTASGKRAAVPNSAPKPQCLASATESVHSGFSPVSSAGTPKVPPTARRCPGAKAGPEVVAA